MGLIFYIWYTILASLFLRGPNFHTHLMLKFLPVTTAADFERISVLAFEIWTDHYVPIVGPELIEYMLPKFQSPEAIAEQVAEGVSYYLLQHQEQDAGYISFYPKEGALFLSKLYVHKRFRGLGLGRAAMNFIVAQAQADQLPRIRLTVNKKNTNSIAAYERMDFRKVDDVVFDIGQGFFMDDYVMEKTL